MVYDVCYPLFALAASLTKCSTALVSHRDVDDPDDERISTYYYYYFVGTETAAEASNLLGHDGILCPIVSVAEPHRADNAFGRSLGFQQVALGAAYGAVGVPGDRARKHMMAIGHEVTRQVLRGDLVMPSLEVITVDQAGAKLTDMLKANTTGKIVLGF